eukprot:2048820-Alexandrium_andersonii.AAC.1
MYVTSTQNEATHKATTPRSPCAMACVPSHRAWRTAQSARRWTRAHPHRSEEVRVGQEETVTSGE